MKVRIVIQTINIAEDGALKFMRHSEVWSGELEIIPENEYLAKISILSEGAPYPICDVPFSPGVGYYQWIPPRVLDLEEIEDGWNIQPTEPKEM